MRINAATLLRYLGVDIRALTRCGLKGRAYLTELEAEHVIADVRRAQGEALVEAAHAALRARLEAKRTEI